MPDPIPGIIVFFALNKIIQITICQITYILNETAWHRPEASAMARILVPLPRFVLPTAKPFFCWCEATVYEGLANIDLVYLIQIFGQLLGNALENT